MFSSNANPFGGEIEAYQIVFRQTRASGMSMSPKEALENLRSAILSGALDNFTLALKIGQDIIYDQSKSPTSGHLVSGGGEEVAQFPSWVIAVVVSVTSLFFIIVAWWRRRHSASQVTSAPHAGGRVSVGVSDVGGGGGCSGDGGRGDGGEGLTRQAEENSPSTTDTEYNPVMTATRTQSGNSWAVFLFSSTQHPPPTTSPPINRPVRSAPFQQNHFTLPNAVESHDDQHLNIDFSPFVHPNNAAWHIASATIVPDNYNGLRRRRSGGSENSSCVAAQQKVTAADACAMEEAFFDGQPVLGRRQSGGISDI